MRPFKFVILFIILFIVSCSDTGKNTEQTKSGNTESDIPNSSAKTQTIVFFGNSLTAGYGLNQSESFPSVIQQKIDSLNLNYTVVNAGLSGETSAGGNTRVDWILKQPVKIFVLELGANDGLRGIPVNETKRNLQLIIDKVKSKYPEAVIILAGMQVPPNMGAAYSNEFKSIFPELAEENNIELIPFLLEGVGGEVKLNQADGIHPTAEGQKILARNIWEVLESHIVK